MDRIVEDSFPGRSSTDARCWNKAYQIYRDEQGKKNPASQTFQGPLVHSCEDLLASTNAEKQKFRDKSSGFGKKYHRIVEELQKYCTSINVMIQHQPTISALVWGSILLIISTSIEYHEAPKTAIDGLEFVIRQIGRWQKEVDTWNDNSRVCESMTNVYVHVLRFLAVARTTLQKGRLAKTARAFLLDGQKRLQKSLKELSVAVDTLDREAGTANNRCIKDGHDRDRPASAVTPITHKSKAYDHKLLHRQKQYSCPVIFLYLTMTAWPKWHLPSCVTPAKRDESLPPDLENALRLSLVSQLKKFKLPGPRIKQAAKDTCRWFFPEPLYQQFIASQSTSPLVVYGPAGCGKSTLAEVIRQDLSYNHSQLVITYFFGPSASGDEETLISFASSLLSQLLSFDLASSIHVPATNELSAIQNALNNGHTLSLLFHSLWAALMTILSRPRRVFLIIDGLDEYQGRTRGTDLGVLTRLLNAVHLTTSGSAIILSREDSRLVKAWPKSEGIVMDSTTTLGDVDRIIAAAFENAHQAEPELSKLPRRIFHDVQKRALQESRGSMLWLEMYLEYLRSSTKNKDYDHRISSFPSTLTEVYAEMNRTARKTLTPEDLEDRYALLQMAVVSRRPMTLSEVTSLHDFVPNEIDVTIARLSKPFLVVSGGRVEFLHSSAREFMLSQRRPEWIFGPTSFPVCNGSLHQDLAEKTLLVLLKQTFADLDNIKRLILRNTEEIPGDHSQWREFCRNEPAYDYSAKYWYIHITEVSQPSKNLKSLLSQFLDSCQFVHWAEYTSVEDGEDNRLARARGKLQEWARGRFQFDAKQYAIVPFQRTSSLFESEAKDLLMKWLALKELGNYLFLVNDTDLTWKLRNQVAKGLRSLLGPTDPLALRALSDAAFGCFAHDDMRTALADYQFLYETQRRISGPEETATLMALAYRGQAEYYLGDFHKAVMSLSSAVESFSRKYGKNNINTLGFLWNIAIIREAHGENDKALEILHSILKARAQLDTLDETDLFAVMISFSIGNISRRRNRPEETFSQLNKAYLIRLGIWNKGHWLVVDAALARAIAYWQFGMHNEGLAQLNDIKLDQSLPSRFQRVCQWTHLRALLSIRGNNTREAIKILQELALRSDRHEVNRALLWSMLDLATLLRRNHLDDDAASLFHNLVAEPDCDPGDDEPDPPRFLRVAEKALRFTRKAQIREAQDLLHSEGLKWVREQDLWFWMGGPRADTEFMREP